MNIKALTKKVLTHSCVYFSILTAIYSAVVMIIYVDEKLVLLDASRVLLFFVASLLFSLANAILSLTKLHGALRRIIHYLLTVFAFCSCMMLPISPDGKTMLVGISLFSLLYLAITGIALLFKSAYRKKAERTEEYTSQFKKK